MGTTPVSFVLNKFVVERRRAVTAESRKTVADVTTITQETLSISGIVLATMFGRQKQEIDRCHNENQRLADLSVALR